jgi:hypothetical protein
MGGEACVTISADDLRGAVVDTMAAAMTTNLPIQVCTTTVPTNGCPSYVEGSPRGASGQNITAANVAAFNTLDFAGQQIWCCAYQAAGDANGDGYVNPEDYLAIFSNIGSAAAAQPRADVNHDGFVNPEDYLTVFAHIGAGDGAICP